jgi:hypothetical protein
MKKKNPSHTEKCGQVLSIPLLLWIDGTRLFGVIKS